MIEGGCPFPGLLPFQEEDAPFFFGRDRETGELLKRLEYGRFLAVIGVSGSGKSSLVHAGVKPELHLANPAWRIVEMKPGDDPLGRLAQVIGQDVPGHSFGLVDCLRDTSERVLVIIDQFEEIFPYRKQGRVEANKADLFVQQLLRASAEPGSALYVLLTMRTDYLGHCALFRNLPEALNGGTYLVPRLMRQEQEEAIRSPLSLSGVEIDPEVVDLLLNLAEVNRDELPVLQHLLKRQWEEWGKRGSTGAITRADYHQTGGWERAIAQDAHPVLKDLLPSECEAVKRVYQRITEKGSGERPIRTPCSFASLIELASPLVAGERLRKIFEALRRRDLLVWEGALQNDTRVDIPHECMTWRWFELAAWIEEEDRDRQRLEFIDQSRRAGMPLAGLALGDALGLLKRITPPWVQRYQLDAGALVEHIEESRRRVEAARRRKRNVSIVGLAIACVAFAALGLWARNQKSLADMRAEEALTQQLAKRSEFVFGDQPAGIEVAALLAAQSMWQRPTFDADRILRLELDLLPRTLSITNYKDSVGAVAFSPDSKWLAMVSETGYLGTIRVVEAATGKDVSRLQGSESGFAVAFSPDGLRVAAGGSAGPKVIKAATGEVQAWGGPQKDRSSMPFSAYVSQDIVSSVAFSPDGRWLAEGHGDGTARVRDAATGKEISRLEHEDAVNGVAFSPDGKWLATASDDWTARMMEAATGKEVWRLKHGGLVRAVAFSPDGKWVASASYDGTARVIEAATGKEVSHLRHGNWVTSVAFSPDSKWVATGSWDNTARVMEAKTGTEISRLEHADAVARVTFSPDGKWVATGSRDNTTRIFEAATGREVLRLSHDGPVNAVAFSPDGKILATGSSDETVRATEAKTGNELLRLQREDAAKAVTFSADGRWVAVGGTDKTSAVMDAATGRAVVRLKEEAGVNGMAFSADGRWMATAGDDGRARVIELPAGREISRLRYGDSLFSVALSPDGKWLATGSGDWTARVVEVATGTEISRLKHDSIVTAVAFSADGRWVATGTHDGTARVMDAARGIEVCRLGHLGELKAVAFSPNGKLVATASHDGNVRVMDAATGKEVSHLKHGGAVTAVIFSPNSKSVASLSEDNTARVMEAATGTELHRIALPGSPLAIRFNDDGIWLYIMYHASYGNDLIYAHHPLLAGYLVSETCEKVTRNLTVEEWKQYASLDIPYRRTCENLPFPPDYK